MFAENFIRIDKEIYEIKKIKEEEFTSHQKQVIDAVNKLENTKLVVFPDEREEYLLPFAELCYGYHSPFRDRGPQFFASMLFLAVEFRLSDSSKGCMSVGMIDNELQKIGKKIRERY